MLLFKHRESEENTLKLVWNAIYKYKYILCENTQEYTT